jgi:hypothetical protein
VWNVSERFIAALRKPQRRRTVCTYTPPGGDPVEFNIQAGSVTVDGGQRIRRRADIQVQARSAQFDAMTADGTLFEISHGLSFGSEEELVPVFAGELILSTREFAPRAGAALFPLQDLGAWIARTDFVTPYVITVGTSRVTAISNIVQASRPGTAVVVEATGGGTVGAQQMWNESRWDAISALATDGGLEAFFRPDGAFVIRDAATTLGSSVWSLTGVLKQIARERPHDRLYNTVVVRPSATDGSQTWAQQVAQITDAAHPRHPSKVGVVPYFYAAPTASSGAAALSIAHALLDRVTGTTESLSLQAVSNPALEAGDVVTVATPMLNGEGPFLFRHFTDGFSLDLATGGMSMNTRSSEVTVT